MIVSVLLLLFGIGLFGNGTWFLRNGTTPNAAYLGAAQLIAGSSLVVIGGTILVWHLL
jgi:hypothetical protein